MGLVCLKTGCNVWLPQYSCYVHGDAHVHMDKNILVIRTTPILMERDEVERLHYEVHRVDAWFDKHKNFGTLIATNWTYFGYEGRPI